MKWSFIHSPLQDDLGLSAGNDLCVSALSTRQCFGETYPVFFCIYIFNWNRKAALRLPLVKHATPVNNRHASDCIIQSHNRWAASSCLNCCEARFVCGFYIFSPRLCFWATFTWANEQRQDLTADTHAHTRSQIDLLFETWWHLASRN